MTINVTDFTEKVRIAIDEIVGQDEADEFISEMDTEIQQAVLVAVTQLLQELPEHMLLPKSATGTALVPIVQNADGTGALAVPDDYLRLVRFKLQSWVQDVRELTDATSDEGRMQASEWTRGTPEKPKVMMGGMVNGIRVLNYYTAGKVNGSYSHTVEEFSYVPSPTVNNGQIDAGMTEACEPLIIYRTAGIVMDGKMRGDLADRFYKLSTVTATTQS